MVEALLKKAGVLAEALPYMRRYAGCCFVVKYGGHAMGDAARLDSFARDVVLLKRIGINPVVVHGGGPQINRMLDRLSIKSEFVDGLRVTDEAAMEVVEMVLAGSVNKQLAAAISRAGGLGIGISGKDGGLVRAERLVHPSGDLGLVGRIAGIERRVLDPLIASEMIPVIAPLGLGEAGETYNINADTMAGSIAGSLGAARMMLLTDVPGVKDASGGVIPELSPDSAAALIADGTISGGMIPKVETALHAVAEGAAGAVILDGRPEHALLLEIFTEAGFGTLIRGRRA
jgi:acetylglutamate kinase